ncbi:hypothetical protein U9M48_007787 [Paspalum notatum var. saurae]|uniref:Uncharacterized protein n=1 Tax=Paspalum notatum var. saurae TaxID=547442 RepID=A0AAQ3SNQ6_PASNO
MLQSDLRIGERAQVEGSTYDPPPSGTSGDASIRFENTDGFEGDAEVDVHEVNPTALAAKGDEEAPGVNVTAQVPEGLADEGERIPDIVEQMNNEDQIALQMKENGDSSDNEEALVPAAWRDPGFGDHVVQDGKRREWEYRANESHYMKSSSSSRKVILDLRELEAAAGREVLILGPGSYLSTVHLATHWNEIVVIVIYKIHIRPPRTRSCCRP